MPEGDGPYALSDVLAEEFEAIKPGFAAGTAPGQTRDANGDPISLKSELGAAGVKPEPDRLRAIYRRFYDADLAALCLSGGGIRSASISLGVIQGLADHDLLNKFHYLSTVSGGGYIGSWLSSWLKWSGSPSEVLNALKERRTNSDKEPEPIRHLREYSAYLTPKSGILSGDLWAPIAIIIRNLLLNWLILLPALALPSVVIKIFGAGIHAAPLAPGCISLGVAILGLIFSGIAFRFKIQRLYLVRKPKKPARAETRFLIRSLFPAIVAALLLTWSIGSKALAGLGDWPLSWPGWLAMVAVAEFVYGLVCLSLLLLDGRGASGHRVKDYVAWFFGAFVWGSLVWLGAYLYHKLGPSAQLALVILGPAWAIGAILLGQTVYTMVRSYAPHGDFEREWLGRAGGWYLVAGLGWIVFTAVVLIGPLLFRHADEVIAYGKTWVTALGAISGAATAFLGKSSLTGGTDSSSSWSGLVSNIGLKVAGPLFAAILLILLSVAFDAFALGDGFETSDFFCCTIGQRHYSSNWWWTWGVAGVLGLVMLIADFLVNVNRFSLHAVYRNRLIRCYLGGPHAIVTAPPKDKRKPDGFTGFDETDNIRLTELWSAGHSGWRPYHVINMTLNLASTKNLAWQERKAMSFIATPKFCGAAGLGFRGTAEYGDPKGGMSLGTAMAISGAAINSNMGYHSSPTIAFLLTLLNVRLGWWLGNPGAAGDTFRRPNPQLSVSSLSPSDDRLCPTRQTRPGSRCLGSSPRCSSGPTRTAPMCIFPMAAISRISAFTRCCGGAAG